MIEKRIIAIDYGKKRTGLAISDPTGIFAQPIGVIETQDIRNVAAQVKKIVRERNATKVVVGMPFRLNGTTGESAKTAFQLAALLEKEAGLPVETWDERLTTVRAESALRESGQSRAKRKKKVDAVAAQLILQSYLDRINRPTR